MNITVDQTCKRYPARAPCLSMESQSSNDVIKLGWFCADLIRDVMTKRLHEAEGGMPALQHEVLGLLLAAYDRKDTTIEPFLAHTMRHHICWSLPSDVGTAHTDFAQDELIMSILSR